MCKVLLLDSGVEMDDRLRISLLYDFYSDLLTKKQAESFEMYYFDDLSLQEVAGHFDISRQAVSDLLHRTKKILENYEKKMGLMEKYLVRDNILSQIQEILDCKFPDENKLSQIRPLIEKLKQ